MATSNIYIYIYIYIYTHTHTHTHTERKLQQYILPVLDQDHIKKYVKAYSLLLGLQQGLEFTR